MHSRRKTHSHRGSRSTRLLLLSLGLCTFFLAGTLAVLGFLWGNAQLRFFSLCYIMAAALFMSLRALLLELKERRKRNVRRRRDVRAQGETTE